MKIEVGYGLEGVITDAVASRVIRGTLTPAFKTKNYGAGIERAFDALIARGAGDASAEPQPGCRVAVDSIGRTINNLCLT